MTVTRRACPIYLPDQDNTVPDKNRTTQGNKDKPSMARYLQEPPGVAERIALSYKTHLDQNQQHVVDQAGGNAGALPAEDELMKELVCLSKGGSTA